MRRWIVRTTNGVGLLLLLTTIGLPRVAAAASPRGGITVAPAFVNADLAAGSAGTTVAIGVRNNFSVPISMTASLSRLKLQNNNLVPTGQTDTALSTLVNISPSSFSLAPNQSINVELTINNTTHLTPGGHYVGVLFTQTAAAAQQITIEPAIDATLFIVKHDGAIGQLSVTSVNAEHSLFSLPSAVNVTFHNSGNVFVVPHGLIQIKKSSLTYLQGPINANSSPLFQNNSYTLQSDLLGLAHPHLPGHYSVTVAYRFDGETNYHTVSTSFWYVPKNFVALSLLVIATVYWLSNGRRRRQLVALLPDGRQVRAVIAKRPGRAASKSTEQISPLTPSVADATPSSKITVLDIPPVLLDEPLTETEPSLTTEVAQPGEVITPSNETAPSLDQSPVADMKPKSVNRKIAIQILEDAPEIPRKVTKKPRKTVVKTAKKAAAKSIKKSTVKPTKKPPKKA